MRVENFKADSSTKLSSAIMKKYPLSYSRVKSIINKKDVKVNGKRVSKDQIINAFDEITFYYNDETINDNLDIIFEDENIVVVFKPRQIEVVNEIGSDFLSQVSKKINSSCYAVHRLDRNTIGLVIFAKNEQSKSILDKSFKNRTIDKNYLALVYGKPKEKDDMIAYLKKDSNKSLVYISDTAKDGYEKIQTKYKLVKTFDSCSLVDIKLVTGKTHQIRAHFAHIGCPIIGDEKYGYSEVNREYKMKYQCLCAYKIEFHFKDNILKYLDGKVIELSKEKIDFLKQYK